MGEISCDVCKDQSFFCPKCKSEGIHQCIKLPTGEIIPSVTKIQAEPYDVNTGEKTASFPMYEFHNFICHNCSIIFGIHNLGKRTMITGSVHADLKM